ncbi:hypothetical protein CASFOL_030180 [Castilleja foliolosa]|uniref:IPT/TIG domain-containing protein n=1 Tax=Castilleja foliolosa TaxID=1961234 RepID=A0ABD3CA14_9LAMI
MSNKGYEPDNTSYTTVVSFLCRYGEMGEARDLVSKFIPSVPVYNALISGYCREGKIRDGFELFDEMTERGIRPNVRTYTTILNCLMQSKYSHVNSNTNSAISDPAASWPLSEESDCAVDRAYYGGSLSVLGRSDSLTIKNHEQTLHEINTLDWDELLVPDDPQNLNSSQEGNNAGFEFPNQYQMIGYRINDDPTVNSDTMISGVVQLDEPADFLHNLGKDGTPTQAQNSFRRLISYAIADSPESVGDQAMQSGHQSLTFPMMEHHHQPPLCHIFNISDISPAWALSTDETKILIVGSFNEGLVPHAESKLYIACGDSIHAVEVIQPGVFRCLVSPQAPGLVNLYLTLDGHKPFSQVLTFEFHAPAKPNGAVSYEDKNDWEEFQLQMRFAHLLFSSSKGLNLYSTKPSQTALKEAKAFARKTLHISEGYFRCKVSERDEQGQGVIHLCAVLGYTWAVYPFLWSGLSLDYRDKDGWTSLHWTAYYGREKMAATLLSAGAKPNLVTDPTPQNPAYRTAADAAARIQAAFREHSFNVRANAVEIFSPEMEARNIVAAMKIQHAFRNYETPKKMAAAARIQYRFRSWKIRKDFLNMRRQTIRIQRVMWKRTFSKPAGNKRVERSVVRVQALFRLKQAQEEYRRMKLEQNKAKMEYEGLLHRDFEMG